MVSMHIHQAGLEIPILAKNDPPYFLHAAGGNANCSNIVKKFHSLEKLKVFKLFIQQFYLKKVWYVAQWETCMKVFITTLSTNIG